MLLKSEIQTSPIRHSSFPLRPSLPPLRIRPCVGSQFINAKEDMLILFAASNDGGDYGDASIGAPGNAKNVLTVGSAESTTLPTTTVSYFSSRGPTSDGRLKVWRWSRFLFHSRLFMHTRCALGSLVCVT